MVAVGVDRPGRSHWKACGPAGIGVEWDAEVTRKEDNSVLAWRSAPGSALQNSGIIHFRPNALGGTQLDIQMRYNPPAGALGHALAAVFGSDPKHAMDEDLVRLKSLLEDSRTTVQGHRVTREEVLGRG